MSNKMLYTLWGALYAICAGLGFVSAPGKGLRILTVLLSVALFVPPLLLNYRAAQQKDRRTLTLVRNLALAWLLMTTVLLVTSFLTAFSSEVLGNILHSLLTIAASPLVASGNWALAIFGWACVFFDGLSKLDQK